MYNESTVCCCLQEHFHVGGVNLKSFTLES